jgi:hypothetical protein
MTSSAFTDFGPQLLYPVVSVVIGLMPIWLPIFLGWLVIDVWFRYVRYQFIKKEGSVLLEIKLPKELPRSPHAMEVFLTSIWQKGSVTWIDSYFKGKIRPWFSLEIVSLEGKIHFYIWTMKKYRSLIESHLYGQFPGIEVVEAVDYAKAARHDLDHMAMWGTMYDFELSDAYPIKSYIDFGLDKTGLDEEDKIDPLTSLLEYMGSIGKGEQLWFQILIQAHRKVGIKDGHLVTRPDYKKAAQAEIQAIREKTMFKSGDSDFSYPNPTKMQSEVIAAIERHLVKWPFETCLRGVYLATKDAAKIPVRVSGVIGAWRAWSGNTSDGEIGFNQIKLGTFTDFDHPWEDFMRMRRSSRERKMLDAYKRRSYFQWPYKHWLQKPHILSTEEVASLYHFPGALAQVPGLERIPSKKSEAPSNLPV